MAKGTNPELIDRIVNYAEQLKLANVSQETKKETTKAISEEATNWFNLSIVCVNRHNPLAETGGDFTELTATLGYNYNFR